MNAKPDVSAILLAAGLSSRMGDRHKLLLPLQGKSVIRHTAENILRSRIAETIAVVGANQEAVTHELAGLNLKVVYNPVFEEGMSTSLQAGLAQVAPASAAVLIVLADQPNLKPRTFNLFLTAFQEGAKGIVASRYGTVTGNPVLFGREYFQDLRALRGDIGAKSIVVQHGDKVQLLDLPEEATFDIDTPGDFERAKAILKMR